MERDRERERGSQHELKVLKLNVINRACKLVLNYVVTKYKNSFLWRIILFIEINDRNAHHSLNHNLRNQDIKIFFLQRNIIVG